MKDSSHEIRLRIEWCRRMRSRAGTQDQQEDWRTEEAGCSTCLACDGTGNGRTAHVAIPAHGAIHKVRTFERQQNLITTGRA